MSESQRKVELQSPEDLRYLINNAKRAASEKIDRAFPPMPNQGEDAMKIRVQELVDEYITQTFSSASANISINGHDATLPSSTADPILTLEEYEPLNAKLSQRVLDLARKEEDLLIEIAALRREAPLTAVASTKTAFKEGMEVDEEVMRGALDRFREGGSKEGRGMGLEDGDVGGLGAGEEWKRGVSELGRLRDELPGTAGRLEKAKRAGEYVVNEKGG